MESDDKRMMVFESKLMLTPIYDLAITKGYLLEGHHDDQQCCSQCKQG